MKKVTYKRIDQLGSYDDWFVRSVGVEVYIGHIGWYSVLGDRFWCNSSYDIPAPTVLAFEI